MSELSISWWRQLEEIIDRALDEDLCLGDATTEALIPPHLQGRASFLVKAEGVLAGIGVAAAVFRRLDPSLKVDAFMPDGARVKPGDVVGSVSGAVASILSVERTALNFLQRLSGIATQTALFVEAVAGTRARIVDTRKTAPGLRLLDKYAVRMGGGHNHRFNLGDGILIKDNHLAAMRRTGVGLGEAVRRARSRVRHSIKIQVEVTSPEQVLEAVEAGADAILLDNMSVDDMRRAVGLVGGRALLEASGGINLQTVRAAAETGVDLISAGSLTHSVKALDISLELEV